MARNKVPKKHHKPKSKKVHDKEVEQSSIEIETVTHNVPKVEPDNKDIDIESDDPTPYIFVLVLILSLVIGYCGYSLTKHITPIHHHTPTVQLVHHSHHKHHNSNRVPDQDAYTRCKYPSSHPCSNTPGSFWEPK